MLISAFMGKGLGKVKYSKESPSFTILGSLAEGPCARLTTVPLGMRYPRTCTRFTECNVRRRVSICCVHSCVSSRAGLCVRAATKRCTLGTGRVFARFRSTPICVCVVCVRVCVCRVVCVRNHVAMCECNHTCMIGQPNVHVRARTMQHTTMSRSRNFLTLIGKIWCRRRHSCTARRR